MKDMGNRMLKKSASGVLGPLSCSRTPLYAPPAKGPAALTVERRVLARRGWEGKKGLFEPPAWLLEFKEFSERPFDLWDGRVYQQSTGVSRWPSR